MFHKIHHICIAVININSFNNNQIKTTHCVSIPQQFSTSALFRENIELNEHNTFLIVNLNVNAANYTLSFLTIFHYLRSKSVSHLDDTLYFSQMFFFKILFNRYWKKYERISKNKVSYLFKILLVDKMFRANYLLEYILFFDIFTVIVHTFIMSVYKLLYTTVYYQLVSWTIFQLQKRSHPRHGNFTLQDVSSNKEILDSHWK